MKTLLAAAVLLFSVCPDLWASSVQLSTCRAGFQCVTGIDRLLIRDTEYRLDVMVGWFEDVNVGLFRSWGDRLWANDASAKVVVALNAAGIHNGFAKFFDYGQGPQFPGFGRGPISEFTLHIPFRYAVVDEHPGVLAFDSTCPFIYSPRVNDSRCFTWTAGQPLAFGVFTALTDPPPPDEEPPVKVPEPSTFWLLLPGLAWIVMAGVPRGTSDKAASLPEAHSPSPTER